MEFFNKKQDVIDLQLTGYGKQLLSRGLFKPVYYVFSDDGVMYDGRWMSGSAGDSQQSEIETRIQEGTPRLKTQNRKIGAEKSVFMSYDPFTVLNEVRMLGNLLEQEVAPVIDSNQFLQLIEKANVKFDFAESEKLLENVLGNKSFLNSNNPAWNALFFHGDLASSAQYYKKNNTSVIYIPQLNCTLKERAYRVNSKYDPYEIITSAKNISKQLNDSAGKYSSVDLSPFFQEQSFSASDTENGTDGVLFIEKDFIFLSLEEANVDFTKDNFMIEVFEITTTSNGDNGEEELVKMAFEDNTGSTLNGLLVDSVFDMEVDEEIDKQLACYLIGKDKSLKNQSIYLSNIFDCEKKESEENVFISPYDNLSEVTTGDTC